MVYRGIMNIRGFVIGILMILFFSMPAFAGYVDNFTRDNHIKEALVLLENNGAAEVFENLEENSVKIAFYDLSQISYGYMNHFAVNSVDTFGNRYILINTKYKNATPEELACIIAHESFHKLKVATYEEEYTATQKEAHYWSILKVKGKEYKSSPLLARLDNLNNLRLASTKEKNLIQEKINKSPFYKKQLATR
jgi:hypothetical protein